MPPEGDRLPSPDTVAYGELPEVMRGMRALGSPRRGGGLALQSRFFVPLLDARKRASAARNAIARLDAFDTGQLLRALDATITRAAADWQDTRESARRALRAELLERTADYARSLHELELRAAAVRDAPDDQRDHAWREWTRQLCRVFETADRSWLALRPVMESLAARSPGTDRTR